MSELVHIQTIRFAFCFPHCGGGQREGVLNCWKKNSSLKLNPVHPSSRFPLNHLLGVALLLHHQLVPISCRVPRGRGWAPRDQHLARLDTSDLQLKKIYEPDLQERVLLSQVGQVGTGRIHEVDGGKPAPRRSLSSRSPCTTRQGGSNGPHMFFGRPSTRLSSPR